MRPRDPHQRVLLVLLAGATGIKLAFDPPLAAGPDAAYYAQVARQVMAGNGLATSVSLAHQGLRDLPAPATIYPIWPLLLGAVAARTGLAWAAAHLAEILYIVDLALLYVLVDRLASRWLPAHGRLLSSVPFTLAHASVLILGLSRAFNQATSLPYTEGLAFLWVLAALLAIDVASTTERRGLALLAAASAGFLFALGYLTRFQLAAGPLAGVLALVVGRHPRRRRLAAAAAIAAALPIAGFAWWLSRFENFSPAMLLDVAAYRQNPALPQFRVMVESPTRLGWVGDKLAGVVVAFDPFDQSSYYAALGAAVYAPFLALGAILWRRESARAMHLLRSRGGTSLTAAIAAGLFFVLPIHFIHLRFWMPWLFGWRYGLPLLFLVVAALGVCLAERGRALRLAAIILCAASILHGLRETWRLLRDPPAPPTFLVEVGAWLDSRPGRTNALAVEPQALSAHTRAGLYFSTCQSPPELTETLLRTTPIDVVLLRREELPCPAFATVLAHLERVASFGEGPAAFTAYVLARPLERAEQ